MKLVPVMTWYTVHVASSPATLGRTLAHTETMAQRQAEHAWQLLFGARPADGEIVVREDLDQS